MSQALCPNCGVGVPDTPVEYDEILYARFSSYASSPGRRTRSFRSASAFGRVALCAPCAAAYRRMARLRATGHKALNYGFAALLIGAVVFALLVSSVPTWGHGVSAYLLATPVVVGLLSVLAGATLVATSAVMKHPATRFLANPTAQSAPTMPIAAVPALSATPAQATEPLSREAARAARARRRRWQRVGWIGLGAVWIVAIIVVLAIITSTISQHSLANRPVTAYNDPLTQVSSGWTNSGGCTFHDGAYHISPPGSRLGLTCLAPAGGYTDFDLSVTAQLIAGAPDAAYGLTFRYADGSGYLFEISGDGHADLRLLSSGSATPLSPVWSFVTGGGPSASHMLRVVATGPTFTLFVDGTQIASYSDNRYTSGEVGLFASQPGMDVAFSSFFVSATP